MKISKIKQTALLFTALISIMVNYQIVFAQVPSSTNYQVPESSFSSGGDINVNSTNYSARGTAGVLVGGQGNSTNYDARVGYITPSEEFLELAVQTSSVNLGVLDASATKYGTGLFYVRSYINGAYVVYTEGSPPTSENGDTLNPLTSASTSSVGTEQFGFNLVSNATPTVGSDPSPNPSTTFANGEAATGYDTADYFKSNNGDIIAQSGVVGPAWGRTDFTISYIANITGITEAGTYVMNHDLIVSPTY